MKLEIHWHENNISASRYIMELGARSHQRGKVKFSVGAQSAPKIYNSMQKIIIVINYKICFESTQSQHLHSEAAPSLAHCEILLGKRYQVRTITNSTCGWEKVWYPKKYPGATIVCTREYSEFSFRLLLLVGYCEFYFNACSFAADFAVCSFTAICNILD